jgi:hypothetical protein
MDAMLPKAAQGGVVRAASKRDRLIQEMAW